jgi:hypothetical protein
VINFLLPICSNWFSLKRHFVYLWIPFPHFEEFPHLQTFS